MEGLSDLGLLGGGVGELLKESFRAPSRHFASFIQCAEDERMARSYGFNQRDLGLLILLFEAPAAGLVLDAANQRPGLVEQRSDFPDGFQ